MANVERTGWRDEGISRRHRTFGFNFPAVDLDMVLAEYDTCIPSALVEYKLDTAPAVDISKPNYRVLNYLAGGSSIPLFVTRYSRDYSRYTIMPANSFALYYVPVITAMSEREYISLLSEVKRRPSSRKSDDLWW